LHEGFKNTSYFVEDLFSISFFTSHRANYKTSLPIKPQERSFSYDIDDMILPRYAQALFANLLT